MAQRSTTHNHAAWHITAQHGKAAVAPRSRTCVLLIVITVATTSAPHPLRAAPVGGPLRAAPLVLCSCQAGHHVVPHVHLPFLASVLAAQAEVERAVVLIITGAAGCVGLGTYIPQRECA